MFDSDKYYDCKLDKLSSFALDRIRPPPPSLKRRILQKQISVVLVLVLLRIEYEKGREAVKELFQLFYTPAFSVYACHLHRSALLLFFFFFSPPLPPSPVRYQKQRAQRRQRKQISFFRRKIEARDGMARYGFPINRWKVSILRLDNGRYLECVNVN